MKAKILCTMSAMLIIFNASAQWTDLTSGVSNDLQSVYFTDANTGWVVGRQGTIIHTTDGGATWTTQNSGTTNDLLKIQMIDNSTGFAVGKNGTFVSYDGTNWTTKKLLSSLDYYSVCFTDANTGWIGSTYGHIDMTTNAGSSWTNQVNNSTYSNTMYDMAANGSSEIWAVGTVNLALKYDGSSWTQQTLPGTALNNDNWSIHFAGGQGFITGKNNRIINYNGSWTSQSSPISDGGCNISYAFMTSATDGYATVIPSSLGAANILKYSSGTWSIDYTTASATTTEIFYGIYSAGGSTYVVGAGGQIKKNGGSSGSHTGVTNTAPNKPMNLTAFPNSFRETVNLSFNSASAAPVTVSICNVLGQEVYHNTDNTTAQGVNTIQCNTGNLAQGMYYVTVIAGDCKETIKAVKN